VSLKKKKSAGKKSSSKSSSKSIAKKKSPVRKKSTVKKKVVAKKKVSVKKKPVKKKFVAKKKAVSKKKSAPKKKASKKASVNTKKGIKKKAVAKKKAVKKVKVKKVKVKKVKVKKVKVKKVKVKKAKAKAISKKKKEPVKEKYVKTGIKGLDQLFMQGIPRESSILVAGGAGSGKTILCLQMLSNNAHQGKKCLYVSFEESEKRLVQHMEELGFKPNELIKNNKLHIERFNPFDITRSVDALLLKAKGELLIDIDPIIFPVKFKPEIVVVDSLTAIASAFIGKEDSYRIYIEQLFRFFEKISATVFLITETSQVPTTYSTTGVEEFLADGVVVLYNIKRGNIRERAIEILKLRGASHHKKIVSFEITPEGLEVYPSQEIFEDIH